MHYLLGMQDNKSGKEGLLRISDLARETGVAVGTIKFYIREGLLPAPTLKTGRNMAYYDRSFIERIRMIKELQTKRFLPLDVIRAILDRDDAVISQSEIDTMVSLEGTFYEAIHYAPGHPPITVAEAAKRFDLEEQGIRYNIALGVLTPVMRDGEEVLEGQDLLLLRRRALPQQIDDDEGSLPLGDITAALLAVSPAGHTGCFPLVFLGGQQVQQIVANLEGDGHGLAVLADRLPLLGRAAGDDRPRRARPPPRVPPRLLAQHGHELRLGRDVALADPTDVVSLAFEGLPRAKGHLFDELQGLFGTEDFPVVAQHLEDLGVEGVADVDAQRRADESVDTGSAAAQIGIVFDVVVDDREGLEHFEGGSGADGGIDVAAEGLTGEEHKGGPGALSSPLGVVAHGPVHELLRLLHRKEGEQLLLYERNVVLKEIPQLRRNGRHRRITPTRRP